MDPNQYKTIERFVHDFEKVAQIVHKENPDCIIAPMFGAVPFIDVLNIVDPTFPHDKVEYVPASSKVYRLREVLRGSFKNLIDAYTPNGGKFLSLDEVISGNSVTRMYKQFETAKIDYANEKTAVVFGPNTDFRNDNVRAFRDSLVDGIKYQSIGIIDSKLARIGKARNKEFEQLLEKGAVIPVETPCIVTMDKTGFFPAKYKRVEKEEGKFVYLPVVDEFCVAPAYFDFLRTVSEIVGKDSRNITLTNMMKIKDSYIWVPEELRTL